MSKDGKKGYMVADFATIPPVACPCGTSRRAFVVPENDVASIHEVEISADSRTHYHKKLTEIYYILEAGPGAAMELDGETVPVRAGMAVFIRPLTRHRAVAPMRILNIPVPPFDPEDEHLE